MALTKRIRYGVIGCAMGLNHAIGIRRSINSEVAAICDIDQAVLQHAQSVLGLPDSVCYLDYRGLIEQEDVDAVVVASPDFFHEEQTVAAMSAGKHVLCEKPMALTAVECRRMVQAADKMGKKLMVGQVCRYAPGFIMTKKLIEQGEIGELYYVESEYAHDYKYYPGKNNWRKDPAHPRDPVIGGGCHAVDLLRWVAGDPLEVTAYSNHKMLKDWPINDTTIGILRFPNDVIGKVFVSISVKRSYTMRSLFYGTRGTIIADNTSPHIILYKDAILDSQTLFESRFPEVHDQSTAIYLPINIDSHNTTAEANEFSDIILNDLPVRTDGRQGASTVAVCCALVESAAKSRSVTLAYDF